MAERKSARKAPKRLQRPSTKVSSTGRTRYFCTFTIPLRAMASESISSSDPEATCSFSFVCHPDCNVHHVLLCWDAVDRVPCSKSSWNMSRCSDPVTMWSIRSSSSLFTCSRSCWPRESKTPGWFYIFQMKHSAARGEYELAGPRTQRPLPPAISSKVLERESIFMW